MKTRQLLAEILIAVSLAALIGCGSPGPPRPPSLDLPQPATDLRAVRKGDHVFLAWTVPPKTTDGQTIRKLGATRVCRSTNANLKDCTSAVGEVRAPILDQKKTGARGRQDFVNSLTASDIQADGEAQIFYAVSVLNDRGRSAGLSNIVGVSAVSSAPPPRNFQARVTAEGIVLTWSGAERPATLKEVDREFRVYRRLEGTTNDIVVGDLPTDSSAPQIVDHSFEWEKTYSYRCTIVTIIHSAGTERSFEGEDTPAVTVFTHDVFPPAVPSGLQAVYSGVGQSPFIDLIWAPDTDADLAGYNVYRKEGTSAPVKITQELVKPPAFRDSNVVAGHTYIYAVTAVDLRGNESAPSSEASETIP